MFWRGLKPSSTSTLARPRSPSSSSTRLPAALRAVARLIETLVLPTPPLPPVTAITCTGPGAPALLIFIFSAERDSGKGMGNSSKSQGQQFFVRLRAGAARQFDGARHQVMAFRRCQIFRHALAFA